MGFGDQSGSKLSTQKTYLQDAFDAGADILVRCFVERLLVENGTAAGIEGTWADPGTRYPPYRTPLGVLRRILPFLF